MPEDGRTTRRMRLRQLLGADDPLPIDPDLAPEGTPSLPTPTGGRGRPGRPRATVLAVVLVGGFLGTLGRYEVETAWPTPAGHFPAATFVINTTGAFALGLLLTVIVERLPAHRYRHLRPFAATGLLGGWTTYSTLVVEASVLGKAGDVSLAAGYLAVSLVCGVSAVALGIALGRSRNGGRGAAAGHDAGAGAVDVVLDPDVDPDLVSGPGGAPEGAGR